MKALSQYLAESVKDVSAYCRKYKQYGNAWMGTYTKAKAGVIYCTALIFTESSKKYYNECPGDAKFNFSDIAVITVDGSWSETEIMRLISRGTGLPKNVKVRACAQDKVDLDAFYKIIPFNELEVVTGDSSHADVKIVRPCKFGEWSVPDGGEDVKCNIKFPKAKLDKVTLSTRNQRPWMQLFTDRLGINAKECVLNTTMPGSFDKQSMVSDYIKDAEVFVKKLNSVNKVTVAKMD
jgi:hypothetical protein